MGNTARRIPGPTGGSPGEPVLRAALELVADRAGPGGFALLDGAGYVALWSRGAARLAGWPPADAIGQSIGRLLGDEPGSLRLIQEAVQRGIATQERDCLRADGQVVRARLTVDRLGERTAPAWLALLMQPVAPSPGAEPADRQVQKLEAVGRMAGGIAHDFNNLLTAIQGHAQLLMEELPAGAAGRDDVSQIMAAADRATALTRQLLAFTRRQQLEPRETDVDAVVRDLQQLLRRLIPEHIHLTFELGPAPCVRVDVGHLEQILLNLALNARDAMPGGGTLSVRTGEVALAQEFVARGGRVPAGRYVQLAVGDSGIGMTRETQDRIFEPFFTTKPEGQGTGLGLATVADIVRQYDGHLNVYSEPGRGSTFKVLLPAAASAESDATAEEPAGGTESVLVVEDDAQLRELATRALRMRGYRVLATDRGEDALALVEDTGGVDLVITDLVIPGMSGRRLAERVRQRHPRARVLFTSGFALQDAVRQGLADRGANYLEKPFSPDRLARTVRETLDRSE